MRDSEQPKAMQGTPMINRLSIAAVSLLAAGPALAGGFAQPIEVPPVAAPVVVATPAPSADWSGPYVGGQLGFGRLSTDVSIELEGEELDEEFIEGDGALYGVHAGYMFDLGRLVVGAEADWDMTSIGLDPAGEIEGESIGEIESVARAKLRLGFDAGRVLPYLTAGVARATFDFEDPMAEELIEDTGTGNFFGLGASFMVSDRFMVGVEALRHNFDGVPELTDAGEALVPFEFDSVVDTVTLRGSFRF